jgi:nitroreductase
MSGEYPNIRLRWARSSPEDMIERSRACCDLFQERCSVRYFSSESLPSEVSAKAVAPGDGAPSGANHQPWTFVVVSDAETKQWIGMVAEAVEQERYTHRMSPNRRSEPVIDRVAAVQSFLTLCKVVSA